MMDGCDANEKLFVSKERSKMQCDAEMSNAIMEQLFFLQRGKNIKIKKVT
jgi:hypothetical protein